MEPMQGAAPPPAQPKQGSDRFARGSGFDTTGLGTVASRASVILKFRRGAA
jgi:hypothetical protein